jgi:predicted Fe-Mo cluster-binding NifX family protein
MGGLKVAIPAEGPDFNARVGDRLGLAPHLLVIDLETKNFEAIRSSGAGMQVVAVIIAKKSDVLLTTWCNPVAERYLSAHGVKVMLDISGTVAEALEKFERENLKGNIDKHEVVSAIPWKVDRKVAFQAFRSASRQIKNLLPMMTSVIFLVGLFSAFISEELLSSLFSGSPWRDSFWGASIGSLFSGNPINSYIIGQKSLELGVSLVAMTAFICSWVSVGIMQLPAEIAALGWKFAVVRNLASFGLSVAISLVMMFIMTL